MCTIFKRKKVIFGPEKRTSCEWFSHKHFPWYMLHWAASRIQSNRLEEPTLPLQFQLRQNLFNRLEMDRERARKKERGRTTKNETDREGKGKRERSNDVDKSKRQRKTVKMGSHALPKTYDWMNDRMRCDEMRPERMYPIPNCCGDSLC